MGKAAPFLGVRGRGRDMLTCPPADGAAKNIRVRIMEGSIYTVDDVSDLLGIPRPTLYRYLREYSIPHLRQGGRIRIPEDSFDRITEARDTPKEGRGPARRAASAPRGGGGPDPRGPLRPHRGGQGPAQGGPRHGDRPPADPRGRRP